MCNNRFRATGRETTKKVFQKELIPGKKTSLPVIAGTARNRGDQYRMVWLFPVIEVSTALAKMRSSACGTSPHLSNWFN
jgi:hypothetical protein